MRMRRPSVQTLAVLDALAAAGEMWRYGLELAAETGLKSGTLYPILARLHGRGWLEDRWMEPERPGRPARHVYRLTGEGRTACRAAAMQVGAPPAREALA